MCRIRRVRSLRWGGLGGGILEEAKGTGCESWREREREGREGEIGKGGGGGWEGTAKMGFR